MQRRDDPFVIFGTTERSVLSAYLNINYLLQSKRENTNLTHFLAIRCDNEQIRCSYENFKKAIISKYLPQGFPEKVNLIQLIKLII